MVCFMFGWPWCFPSASAHFPAGPRDTYFSRHVRPVYFLVLLLFFLFGLRLLCLWRYYKVTSVVYWGFYSAVIQLIFALCLFLESNAIRCFPWFFFLLLSFPFLLTLSRVSLENRKCYLQVLLVFTRKNDAVFKVDIWKYVCYGTYLRNW